MSVASLLSPDLKVECVDRSGFSALEPQWDRLLQRTGHDAPFYRHEFIRVWADNFAARAPLHVVTARDEDGLRAALCLVERRRWFHGAPVRMLCGATNVYGERFDLIAHPEDQEGILAVWRHLRDRLHWDVLELPDVPALGDGAEGAARVLLGRARDDGPCGMWESKRAPVLPLGAHDDVQERLSGKFRRDLRRRSRLLAARGKLTVERVVEGADLEARLEEGFAVEASGWKGRAGTAIACRPDVRAFYAELAREAAARGYLSLFFLRCDEIPVAFHYALTYAGKYYLLKLGIDERFKPCAPGHQLVAEVIRDSCERKLVELELLGAEMPWKQDWTEQARPHAWCYAFRDTAFGRALHAAKFTVTPFLKSAAQAWGALHDRDRDRNV